MPRKLRRVKRRRDVTTLRPVVERFLLTGEIALDPGDSVWLLVGLLDDRAREARQCWQAGDVDAAYAALLRCAGGSNFFLAR